MGETIRARFSGRLGRFELDVAFETPARGVTGLFGPSGCGKTTVLRALAGLTRLPEGSCAVGDEVWQEPGRFTPPHRRAIGYVFQEPSLFAHLDVRRNLLFGAPGKERGGSRFFDEILALLGLEPLLERAPARLSGGERQRVALGRALLSRPRLLLMDEPLSALDAAAKDDILPFLERLHEAMALPVVYVTHDMAEIERLADRLVLMRAGRVVAVGELSALQGDPELPLAAARSAAVTLPARLDDPDVGDGLMAVAVDGARFLSPRAAAGSMPPRGAALRLRIAAGDVSLALHEPREATILNTPRARIVSATPLDASDMLVVIALGADGEGARLLARVTRRSWNALGLDVGRAVFAQVKSVALAARGGAPFSL
jgi:molybdate transport system ATP-binding protein